MKDFNSYESLMGYGALGLIPDLAADELAQNPMFRTALNGNMAAIISRADILESEELTQKALAEAEEARRIAAEAEYRSTHDELTGLLNRRGIIEKGTEMLNLSSNTAIIFFDVDKFKKVNDDHGHEEGDILLKEIARIITDNVRDYDLVGRLGGDEFVVVFDTTPREEDTSLNVLERVNIVIERVQASLDEKIGNSKFAGKGVGISGGLAIYDPEIHHSLSDLLQEADGKLYIDKHFRRNTVN